jgi:hypothetical protein
MIAIKVLTFSLILLEKKLLIFNYVDHVFSYIFFQSLAVRLTKDSSEGLDLAALVMAESFLATVNWTPVIRKDFSSEAATVNVVKWNVRFCV